MYGLWTRSALQLVPGRPGLHRARIPRRTDQVWLPWKEGRKEGRIQPVVADDGIAVSKG